MGQTQKLLALAVSAMGTEEGENAAGQVYRRVMNSIFSEPYTTARIDARDVYDMKRQFKTVAIQPSAGTSLDRFAGACAAEALFHDFHIIVKWNDVHICFPPGRSADDVYDGWQRLCDARHNAWLASPERKRQQEEAERANQQRRSALAAAILGAPHEPNMSRNPDGWAQSVEVNNDPYGAAAIAYTATWARLMEGAISAGESVEACADRCSHLADTDGITGFMHGCAVSILSQCWVHGEALRAWHNAQWGVTSESGTLNPALLTIQPSV